MVEFTVFGNPVAQKRHRHHKFGTNDPSKKDKEQFYLQAVKHKPKEPLSGNVFADVVFYMPRPKSHYRTGKYKDRLKFSAPHYYHSLKPDVDNLVKFLFDSISGKDKFIKDDCNVGCLKAQKVYIGRNDKPRTEVKLFALQK